VQQSASERQYAVSIPHACAAVQVPAVQLSLGEQHGLLALQPSPVPPQSAGASQIPLQVSAPLQHGSVPLQAAPVPAQAAGGVHTLPAQESAGLQHGALAQDAPVPAQSAVGRVHVPETQVASPQQASPPTEQAAPTARHVAGAVQTLGPPVHASPALQHSVAALHDAPVPAQAGATQTLPLHVSAASQHESLAHDVPVAAQEGARSGLEAPLQAASAATSAAATRRSIARGAERAMWCPSGMAREDHRAGASSTARRTMCAPLSPPEALLPDPLPVVAPGAPSGYLVAVARTYREWRRFRCPRPLPGPCGAAPRVMR
jgi:hypothetical protein